MQKGAFRKKYAEACNRIVYRRIVLGGRGGVGLDHAAELVRRLNEREEEALRTLMSRYGDDLLRTAWLLLKDRQAAEEAVMDTFVQAYRHIDQLKDPEKLGGWLLRIAINRCRMRLRTWSWRRLIPFADVERLPDESSDPGPEERLLADCRAARLSDAILKLGYKYREAIVLHYFNGWKVADIAAQLGCSDNTVKSRLARGRAMLRELLEEDEEDGFGSGAD